MGLDVPAKCPNQKPQWADLPVDLLEHCCQWLTHIERLRLRLCCLDWAQHIAASPLIIWDLAGQSEWQHDVSRVQATNRFAIDELRPQPTWQVAQLVNVADGQWERLWQYPWPSLVRLNAHQCHPRLPQRPQVWAGIQELNLSFSWLADDDWLEFTPEHLPHLRVLELVGCEAVTDRGWSGFHAHCWPRLEHLSLNHCSQLTNQGWMTMNHLKCPQLRHLDLSDIPVSSAGWQAFSAQPWPLRYLSLVQDENDLDQGWLAFHARAWPQLEVLELGFQHAAAAWTAMRSTDLPRLRHLYLSRCSVTDTDWAAFNQQYWPQLRVLMLEGCILLSSQAWRTMKSSHFPRLERLDLSYCSRLDDTGWLSFSQQLWPQLKELDLSGTATTIRGWSVFCRKTWPRLEQLHVDINLPFQAREFWQVMKSQHLPRLQQLHWDDLEPAGFSGFWMRQTWHHMRVLTLETCPFVQPRHWKYLAPSYFPRLEVLHVRNCQVGDDTLNWQEPWLHLNELSVTGCNLKRWHLTPHVLPCLRVLNLSGNPLVDQGWRRWTAHEWPLLTEVHLNKCRLRGHWIPLRCPALRELYMNHNPLLCDAMWPHLVGLSCLRVLDLENCSGLTVTGWAFFCDQKWPQLTRVDTPSHLPEPPNRENFPSWDGNARDRPLEFASILTLLDW